MDGANSVCLSTQWIYKFSYFEDTKEKSGVKDFKLVKYHETGTYNTGHQ